MVDRILRGTRNLIAAGFIVLLPLFLSSAWAESGPASRPPYGEDSERGKFAEINGIRIYYELYGEGEPLVLIHGSGQSIADMHNQIAHFSQDYQVIVADSRGHGKSGMGEGELNYVQMTQDWIELLDHLGIEKTSVIDWSDGGNISLCWRSTIPRTSERLPLWAPT